MLEFIKACFDWLIGHYALYVVVVMGIMVAFIVIILNLLKKPIKLLTGKIKNEKVRKLVNKVVILLSFGLSVGIWAILCALPFTNADGVPYFKWDWAEIVISGALPVVVYALGDGVITTSKAKAVVETLKNITADGEVDKDEAKELAKELVEVAPDSTADTATTTAKADTSAEAKLKQLLK